jgi:DNA polymerase
MNTELILEVLRMKQQTAKTSVSKFGAFKRCAMPDDRVRGMFQFAGAQRTNRWAGRIVQLHNLARGGNTTKDPDTLAEIMMMSDGYELVKDWYGKPMSALSDTIRSVIAAPEGAVLNVSDLSSIESRVLGWVSDCKKINDTFAAGLDTYTVFASDFYGIPYEQVTKKMRNFCKPPVLGGGFGLGLDGKSMVAYAKGMGVTMDIEEAKAAVSSFRDRHPEVIDFWGWCKKAVFYTTQTGNICEGPHGLKTFAQGEFLFMQLPSGRNIAYYRPRIEMKRAPWGDMVPAFTFMGSHKVTKQWTRIDAHPGFLCENIVQATARDILGVWMLRADKVGFNLFGHVHDELLSEEQTNRLEELNALTRQPIEWAPGLLLDAGGYVAKRYRKE